MAPAVAELQVELGPVERGLAGRVDQLQAPPGQAGAGRGGAQGRLGLLPLGGVAEEGGAAVARDSRT